MADNRTELSMHLDAAWRALYQEDTTVAARHVNAARDLAQAGGYTQVYASCARAAHFIAQIRPRESASGASGAMEQAGRELKKARTAFRNVTTKGHTMKTSGNLGFAGTRTRSDAVKSVKAGQQARALQILDATTKRTAQGLRAAGASLNSTSGPSAGETRKLEALLASFKSAIHTLGTLLADEINSSESVEFPYEDWSDSTAGGIRSIIKQVGDFRLDWSQLDAGERRQLAKEVNADIQATVSFMMKQAVKLRSALAKTGRKSARKY